MQLHPGQPEEELMNVKERLNAAERDRDRARDELKEMKKVADEANSRLTEATCNGKVADAFTELNSVMESLAKSHQELMIKDEALASLTAKLERAKEFEAKLPENNALMEKLKEELQNVKSSEARTLELFSESSKRIQELEAEVEKGKELETKMLDSFALQTKQLEQTKISLEESKIEISSLREKIQELQVSSMQKHDQDRIPLEELNSLKSELQFGTEKLGRAEEAVEQSELKAKNLLDDMESLKNELQLATRAEETGKKAMDDLALALKEVATEASQAKEKLISAQEELEHYKKETEELKEKLNKIEDNYRTLLVEARVEADRYRNTAERLRIEAEESLLAWNEKETGFVNVIKRTEDEKAAALEENSRLLESLSVAENLSITSKQENHKLRDILKQALNEASVAKEAAGIAREENSQLKDILAEKDDALLFITRENENLRINQAAALENIKDLKQMLTGASGKDFKAENNKENDRKEKPEKEHKDGRRLSSTFSFNLKDLIIHGKHKDVEEDRKIIEKTDEEDDDDYENSDPLKGSILDVIESPIAASHHRRKSSSAFTDDADAVNSEDYYHLDAAHIDDLENERNSRKKKALLRRFGEIIVRKRYGHSHTPRKEPLSVVGVGGEGHRKEPSVGVEGHSKEHSFGE